MTADETPEAKCPHCESRYGYPAMPMLDGTPVHMCAECKRIARREDWNR